MPAFSWTYDLNRIEFIGEPRMIRQPLAREADRLAYAKWARGVAVVYGGVALILFGLVVFGKPLGVVSPDQPADRAVMSAAVSSARKTPQPAACRSGHHNMGCPGVPAGE